PLIRSASSWIATPYSTSTKNDTTTGPVLTVPATAFTTFVAGVRAGEFGAV
ncbi:DUF397 domain-containing protein, partial [Streptomyces cyaneofuscatus]